MTSGTDIMPAGNAPDIQPQAIAVKSPEQTFRDLFSRARSSIQQALPRHIDTDRAIKIALVALSRTPRLLECTQRSVLQSVMTAAQLGLDCGGVLGSGYLIPFKRSRKEGGAWTTWYECQFIPGYRGLIDLARRSGQVGAVFAYAVHDGDQFRQTLGTDPSIVHQPTAPHGAPLTHVYAVARLKGGDTQFVVMTRDEVDAIRERSKSKDDGPWVTDYEQMALKTAVRRLCKWLPMSADLAAALAIEDRLEQDDPAPLVLAGIAEAPAEVPDRPVPGVFVAEAAAGAEPADKAGRIARRLSGPSQAAEDAAHAAASSGWANGPDEEPAAARPEPVAQAAVRGPSDLERAALAIDAERRRKAASGPQAARSSRPSDSVQESDIPF